MTSDAEYARRIGVQRSVRNESVNRGVLFEVRIDGYERIGPETLARVQLVNLRTNIGRANLGE